MKLKELIDSTKWYSLLILIILFLVPLSIFFLKLPAIDAWQMSFILFFAIFLFIGYDTRKKQGSNNIKSAAFTLAAYLFARLIYIIFFLILLFSEKYLTPPSLDTVTEPALVMEYVKMLLIAFATETGMIGFFAIIAGWVGAYAAEKI